MSIRPLVDNIDEQKLINMKSISYKCELIYKCEQRDTEQYTLTNFITKTKHILYTN